MVEGHSAKLIGAISLPRIYCMFLFSLMSSYLVPYPTPVVLWPIKSFWSLQFKSQL